jgi:uncharacterized DUF497 family protein
VSRRRRLVSISVYTAFDWDENNVEHVRRHGLEPADVEDAVLDRSRLPVDAHNAGERRWALLGATDSGRVLFVVFTMRAGAVRVVTARDAIAGEKARYRWR